MDTERQDKRFNEITALADRMVELANLMSRQYTRLIEDFEVKREAADDLIEEYDRLVARWADEDEDE